MTQGRIEIPFGAQQLILECGKFAKQANGAVLATLGGTSVLVAVCMSPKARAEIDFFPLTVEYSEKSYAAGKIPGGFFKREGRPSQKETLTARIIDRPIRPLFPEGFFNDVVVSTLVVSSDGENDPDVVATLAASAALHISDIPFEGPIGAVRIGLINDEFVINPTYEQREESAMELFVAALDKGIVMIEGECREVSEAKVIEGLKLAYDTIKPQLELQNKFRKQVGKEKTAVKLFTPHPKLKDKISELTFDKLLKVYTTVNEKLAREEARNKIMDELIANKASLDAYKVEGDAAVPDGHIRMIYDKVEYDVIRKMIFDQDRRADGRSAKEIRQLTSEINVLPRTHGSALFTRGQTQSLAVVTLGTKRDEQLIEGLTGVEYSNFMLHYNFPAFSVGEARASRAPGRREIGHGALAAKAIKEILPTKEDFPYTIRIVSEILESNGSSSMASVCAGCLCLMAAGVPIKNPVAGISIGLITGEKGKYKLITDIMGLEDHHGDMDYKIAGSKDGITAIQLDLKIQGLSVEILAEGIQQAKLGREHILQNMMQTIAQPAAELSEYAPRIVVTYVPEEKIGEVIGPGGKMIKRIIEETGVETIDIDDDGKVMIAALGPEAAQKAKAFIDGMTEAPVVGKIYDAVVKRLMNFGVFVEFLPGREGLVHVSELSNTYVKDVASVVKVGDRFKVKLVEIDQMKRLNLSKKQAEAAEPAQSS